MLAGLVGPQVMKHLGASKSKAAKLEIEELVSAVEMYKLDENRYPTTQQGLKALVEKPSNTLNWNGPYLRKNFVPKDPWGQDYLYESPGKHGKFDIQSLGADSRAGGEGEDKDIFSWD